MKNKTLDTLIRQSEKGFNINYISSTKSSGDVLTLEHVKKAVNTLKSKKYQKRIAEEQYMQGMGEMILRLALTQKIITEWEYYYLLVAVKINGALIVSPTMYKRLEKVKMPIKLTKRMFKSKKVPKMKELQIQKKGKE